MSNPFRDFFRNIIAPVNFSVEENQFFGQMRSFSGKYPDFAKIIDSHPDRKLKFLEATNEMLQGRVKEEVTDAAAALSMIGYIPSRNFMMASIIDNNLQSPNPASPEIAKTLLFALKSEQINPAFSSYYFLAGMIYDLLRTTLMNAGSGFCPERITEFLEITWKHGVQVSQIAGKLAQQLVPDLSLQKELCLDGMLHDIGKVLLFPFATPDAFEKRFSEKDVADRGLIKEKTDFGYGHDSLGFLFISRIHALHDVGLVTEYHHQPFLAKRAGETIYTRASILWLVDHVLRYREFHSTKKQSELISTRWFEANRPALKKCTPEQFKKALNEISTK